MKWYYPISPVNPNYSQLNGNAFHWHISQSDIRRVVMTTETAAIVSRWHGFGVGLCQGCIRPEVGVHPRLRLCPHRLIFLSSSLFPWKRRRWSRRGETYISPFPWTIVSCKELHPDDTKARAMLLPSSWPSLVEKTMIEKGCKRH